MFPTYGHCLLVTLFIISLLIQRNTSVCPKSLQLNQNQIARNISQAIVQIVDYLFLGKYQQRYFNLQVKVRNPRHMPFFQDVTDETWKLLDSRIGIYSSNGKPIPVSDEIQFSILLVDSAESLRYLYYNIVKFHLYIHGSYFIVLYTLPSPNHYYDELYRASELSLSGGIAHANILVYAGVNSILLFHDIPYSKFHCNANVPVINNKFTNDRWLHTDFYVSKAKNLHGCPLVCTNWEHMPYFKIKKSSTETKQEFLGMEGRLLEYLSGCMNFTLSISLINDQMDRIIYDQSNLFKELFGSGTDFVLADLYYKPTSLLDSYVPTQTYYLSTFCFVASSKTDPYDPFVKLLLPFTSEIWLILVLMFMGGNALVYFITRLDRQLKYLVLGRTHQRPVYNMIVISLGGAVSRDPRVPFSRFLLMVWLLSTFVLRTVYQGLMFQFMIYELHIAPPKTIQELQDSGYTVLMTEVTYTDFQDLDALFESVVILNGSDVESFDMLRHPEEYDYGKMAILTAQENFRFYKRLHPDVSDLYVVPEVLFTQRLSIYMKKNSIFLNGFNIYIKSYINEGLMNRWERFELFDNNDRHHKDESPKPMDLHQLYGALILLVICLAMCSCIFVAELCIFRFSIWSRKAWPFFWRKRCKKNVERI